MLNTSDEHTMKSSSDSIASMPNPEECWAAVVNRDSVMDGKFYYTVSTTGVYCKPSCASRQAIRVHVQFHQSIEAAVVSGFRACQRCKPDQLSMLETQAQLISGICTFIEQVDSPPKLDQLATMANMSRFHFHRLFKRITGVTPRAYAESQRMKKLRTKLADSRTVTEAIYDVGYQSSGNFYSQSDRMLGMTPKRFRAGGLHIRIRFALGECELGAILVAATDKGICAISLGDDAELLLRELQDQFPQAEIIGGDADFEQMIAKVVGLLENPADKIDLPLDIQGTAFQRKVWQVLSEIPSGTTLSYREIAARIGSPKAVRAVGHACASNRIALVIPCHRVVRTDGGLSGYRWGIDRKRALLLKESKA
ncbi:MAG: bifunctional DNA-binding transcriptional regulator/O6-methylguanine-DNA methyltransferase Ada [Methylophilaceae bacterium]|nr:bifunctional DNA-binding transcriptional regulator/O6-methylguanine-DNA methyltransferase Ada [Methyloradius sp.]